MFLSLLGACTVVGPLQGSEWEPASGLLSKDHSCRNPQCCGNLLVPCLFLIWQAQHYWHQITRTHPSMKKVIKVPPQKWAVPSMRHDTCFEVTSKSFYSAGKFRGLDAHVQQWAQKKSWEYQRSLQGSGARYLLSWQHQCQCPPWDFHTPSELTFCTTSFSSTCMLPHDRSCDIWHIPWYLRDEHSHLIGKPLLPDLGVYYQRMEPPLVHSQEEVVPLEPAVSMHSHPTSTTLATVLSNHPSQRPQFCSRESLPLPSNQQVGICTWKSWDCLQQAWAPWMENQTLGREDTGETQAPEWANERESHVEHAREIEASGRQLPVNLGMEDNAETKVLEWESQRLVISKSDGEILTPGWENPDHVGVEHRAKIQKLGKRNQREARDETSSETQTCRVDNQEQLRCKVDADIQTVGWGNQDKSRNEGAIETQVFEKNREEARGEDLGEAHTQGLRKQGQAGSEKGEEFQEPWWGKQDQTRGDAGTEIQAEERGNKGQDGGEHVVQSQIPGRENLGEIKQEDGIEIQALGWGKRDHVENENIREIQTPGWEQGGRSEKAVGEIQKQLRHEFRVGWGSQGLRRDKDAGETQISRRKNLREIREEDWVVIQTLSWEDQRPAASEVNRECETACWGNWVQIGGGHRAEIQAPEKRDQRKDRDEGGINTAAPEVETHRQLRGDTHVDPHPPDRRNQEPFGDETSTDIQVPEMENLRGIKDEDGKEAHALGEENQGQLSNEINGKIHTPKWKTQEHIRSKDGANTQASDAGNWEESTSKSDGETRSAEWKREEQAGGENGTETQAPEKRNQKEAGGEDGMETWAPGEDNQSLLRGDIDRKTHLLEWKNQEQMGGENRTEIRAPEKRNQRDSRGEDGAETQRPESENLGQLDSEDGGSHPSGRRDWEQSRGKNDAEDQTLEKSNQKEVGSEDGRKIQRLRGVNQKLLKSKANGKTCTSEWKNQEQTGGENGSEIQTHGKRNRRGPTGENGRETRASGGNNQEQLRSQSDGEIQVQGPENQKNGGEGDEAEIPDVASPRKYTAEDAEDPGVPRGGIKDQVRERDVAKGNLRAECSGVEGPPVLAGSGYGAMEQEQVVPSATCPEMKPLPHQGEPFLLSSGEGAYLARQSSALARRHRVGISLASPQAPPKPQRSRPRNQRVKPVKASGLAWQLQEPQSLAVSLNLLSSCRSDSCGQAPQAATALVGVCSALPVLPKRLGLGKSQQLLLASLMRWKIAHLKWGLPQRVLESHLLFNLLDPGPLPFAGVRLPGLHTACELQQQQERLCEAQGSRLGVESPEKSQRIQPPKRKSSKLPTQARALEKCRPWGLEPMGLSIHPRKSWRVKPPGSPREKQAIQKEAPSRAKRPAPRNPRLVTESGNWCGQERVREPSTENSWDRKMVRPGASQMAERAPSRVRTSYSRAGQDRRRKKSSSREASKPHRLRGQQPTPWRRESLESRGVKQKPPSCSIDTSGSTGSLHSATASLSVTLLNKTSWSPHLAKHQHSAPNPNLMGSELALLPKAGDPHVGEDSIGGHISSKRDLQPPGPCCAGAVVLPKTESDQGQWEPENPSEAPQNPAASKKFGFMKYLRSFLLWLCFRK